MTLTILNNTGNQLSYVSGTVIVAANGSTTVPITQLFQTAIDSQLISDCVNSVASLSDGVNTYTVGDAVSYLRMVSASLGSQVVGYIGATSPLFAILVGGKDTNGVTQPGKMNAFRELVTQFSNLYTNIAGNKTTVVKSGAGRLHGIMVNNNTTGGQVVVYDNTAGSGTKIATFQIGTPSGGLLSTSGQSGPVLFGPLGLEFTTGLTVVTSGANSNDITVLYQ